MDEEKSCQIFSESVKSLRQNWNLLLDKKIRDEILLKRMSLRYVSLVEKGKGYKQSDQILYKFTRSSYPQSRFSKKTGRSG